MRPKGMRGIRVATLVSTLAMATAAMGCGGWTDAQLIARFSQPRDLDFAEIGPLLGALAAPRRAVRISALRFWPHHLGDAVDAINNSVDTDGRLDRGPATRFLNQIFDAMAVNAQASDPVISRAALRALCLLGRAAESICSTDRRCAVGLAGFSGFACGRLNSLANELRRHGELFDDPEPTVVFNVCLALDSAGPGLRFRLLQLRQSSNRLLRAVAVDQLRTLDDADLIRTLGPLLDDPDLSVRMAAQGRISSRLQRPMELYARREGLASGLRSTLPDALRRHQVEGWPAMCISMLADPEGRVRAAALDQLFGVRTNDGKPLVDEQLARRLFTDPDPQVRATALELLAAWRPRDISELIATGLGDPDAWVVMNAEWLASGDFNLALTNAAVRCAESTPACKWFLDRYFSDPSNADRVDGWLGSPNLGLRRSVITALVVGKVKRPMLQPLLGMLNDSDPQVLICVAEGLSREPGPEAARALLQLGGAADESVRLKVIEALKARAEPASIPFLTAQLSAPRGSIRRAARGAIDAITG